MKREKKKERQGENKGEEIGKDKERQKKGEKKITMNQFLEKKKKGLNEEIGKEYI